MARLRPFGISFDKSLEDLIKGIRANGNNPEKLAAFFDSSIQECKDELKTSDIEQKSIAILKLTYLEMYGFDMSWCSLYVLDVLSSPKFQHKRIGYLAAIQIMERQNNDDALMLMTNQLKKDLNSSNYIECGLAISGIASIVTTELAHDICDDLAKMLNHSKPFIRKRAVLAMYKVFLRYPESLRTYFDQIVDKLDDPDSSVVSATVNVICELAHANPKNYIELTPRLYGLMKDTNNNWMAIRLLKLFSSLSLVEPRLKNKLLPEIVDLMLTTDALSLVYECINSILNGNMLGEEDVKVAELIVNKLLGFFKSDDQNLKYVCLLAFIKTCRIHKELIKTHDKILLSCLYDDDLTIRETSLEIVNYLVSEKNIVTVVTRLLVQLIPYNDQKQRLKDIGNRAEKDTDDYFLSRTQQPVVVSDKYKLRVIEKIIEVGSLENYINIPNFHWYLGVLKDILKLNGDNQISIVNMLVTDQFIDMAVRVPSIRPSLVETCIELCVYPQKTDEELLLFRQGLANCVWIIGEYYNDYLTYDEDDAEGRDEEAEEDEEQEHRVKDKYTVPFIVDCISKQEVLIRLGDDETNPRISAYIEAVAKLFSKYCTALGDYWSKDDFSSAAELCKTLIEWLERFRTSANFEVQERAVSFIEVLKLASDAISTHSEKLGENLATLEVPKFITKGYRQLFEVSQIKPISRTLQQRVPVPADLDLSLAISSQGMSDFADLLEQIQERDSKLEEAGEAEDDNIEGGEGYSARSESDSEKEDVDIEEEVRRKKEREERLKDDPFYITGGDELRNSSTTDDSGEGQQQKQSKRKNNKPKKIRREKVLVLDEEGDNSEAEELHSTFRKTQGKGQGKFLVDASNLKKVDLHEEPTSETGETNEGSYEIEQEVEMLRSEIEEPEAVPFVRKQTPPRVAETVTVTRKKPKKKKRSRRVPIENGP
ncbi:DEKNAAC104942 [Brettanomyces naardenensis]|uniref:AP-3 complex subunit delta n=1 Tax=Brettanomyces naardenensis TaxID=13370 RepID=A0A448YSC2_BRENA|nr:DEKNAAC104942 [Brettanomyces naardenensis]